MSLTLQELQERIKNTVDEISILEILDINAEELVNRFSDKIEQRYDWLIQEFED